MLKVALTGNAGSGLDTVAKLFEALGVPIYRVSVAANWLMENDAAVIGNIIELFGPEAYDGGTLNRVYVSSRSTENPEIVDALNNLLRPTVAQFATLWADSLTTPYAMLVTPVLFEGDCQKDVDTVIGVTAPFKMRLEREHEKTGLDWDILTLRMSRQMSDDEKLDRCDYNITNDGVMPLELQVNWMHEMLLRRATT